MPEAVTHSGADFLVVADQRGGDDGGACLRAQIPGAETEKVFVYLFTRHFCVCCFFAKATQPLTNEQAHIYTLKYGREGHTLKHPTHYKRHR